MHHLDDVFASQNEPVLFVVLPLQDFVLRELLDSVTLQVHWIHRLKDFLQKLLLSVGVEIWDVLKGIVDRLAIY